MCFFNELDDNLYSCDVFISSGRDVEETDEQWLVFQEAIAEKSATPMPKLVTSPKKQGGGAAAAGGTPNYSLLSPVKPESTTSVAALKVEFSLATSAIKGGHKDSHTVQKAKLVSLCGGRWKLFKFYRVFFFFFFFFFANKSDGILVYVYVCVCWLIGGITPTYKQ